MLLAALGLVCQPGGSPLADALPGRLPRNVVPSHYQIDLKPDAKALRFTGHEIIDITVLEASRSITLNALELGIRDVRLDGVDPAGVTFDAVAQTATFTFDAPVPAGPHRLALSFDGKINQSAAGFFALDYPSAEGPQRMLSMQLEPADGRRVVPMWDEPAAKATFALEVSIPVGQTAYSNMPVASSELVDGRRRVSFETTPRMSSYLLHVSIGNLDRVSRRVAGVDVGVVTRKGATGSAAFALDAAAEVLPWYNEYFGTPYPLPKLDMIAAPGQSQFFGAMENWGAIFYFDYALLVDPRRSSESDRQSVFDTVAHEVAHQWFGNLVTMEWWDDLWLNEGFATWMASKVTYALHPEWKPWLQVVGGGRERAMRLDAGAATHAVVQPVTSIEAANQAFDAIAYSKGAAVLRMLEATAGEAGFRDGIRRYMRRYAYGNTTTDQLWQELVAATGKPIAVIARDFTQQPGVPLVSVDTAGCHDNSSGMTLSQTRFETDQRSETPTTWHIPVRIRSVNGSPVSDALMSNAEPTRLQVPGCEPVVVNSGQAGYFRTLYDAADMDRLQAAFGQLPEIDQLGILNDVSALGNAARLPVPTYLRLAGVVPGDDDPLIWTSIARKYSEIDRVFDGSASQEEWRVIARSQLAPQFLRVGWVPQAGQGDTVALLREALIGTLGALDDKSLLAEARARFLAAPRDPSRLPAAIARPVLTVTALSADRATWQEIRARAKAELDPLEKQRLYVALGMARDPQLARDALALALGGEPPPMVAPGIISAVANRHPAMAFDFAVTHEEAVLALVESSSRWSYIPQLARTGSEPALAARVREYAEQRVPESARKDAAEAIAEIERRARSNAHSRPELEAWVSAQSAAHSGSSQARGDER
jgi:aminopeptidase N